ncbi:MAG: carboxypeptidase-like regulatory domain-containing protein [Bacteroidia bacterium]|nr:carboxypeptidase-like regulatory domain-containing protein [Bacteroidia bacterium]
MLWAQNKNTTSEKVFQLSGLILSRTTALPISYAKIAVNKNRRYAISNEEGFFSIPVVRGDTLQISRIGYKTSFLAINSYLAQYKGDTVAPYLYIIHYLLEDTITLPTITIHPYKTATDIKYAILNLPKTMELSIEQAQTTVNPELLAFFMENLPEDENERLKIVQKRYTDYYLQANTQNTISLVDPIAIYKLIKYVSEKSKKGKN